jgi:N-acetylmuramoyl-L-alanine amidase
MIGLLQVFLNFLTAFWGGWKRKPIPITVEPEIEPPKPVANPEVEPTIIWHPSPMYATKTDRKISAIVLHHTGDHSTEGAVSWLCDPKAKASTHYIIGLEGEIYQLVKDEDIAWHAGESEFKGVKYVNQFSIGIELTGDTSKEPLTDPQYKTLIWLKN